MELEVAVAERDAHIQALEAAQVQREGRIAELEESLAERDAQVVALETAVEQMEGTLKEREDQAEDVKGALAQAVTLYRTSLLAAEPEIPEELVHGATVEDIAASLALALARQMVEQVRSQLEAQASQERVLFGAPVRSSPDLSMLSPQEKILLGLSRQ